MLVVNVKDFFSEATNILQQEANATSNRLLILLKMQCFKLTEIILLSMHFVNDS